VTRRQTIEVTTDLENFRDDRAGTTGAGSSRRNPWRTRLIILALAAILLLPPLHLAFGDENDVGYRKSYYQEDDNRIHVSTDTWQYNVGLNDQVRVTGDVVVDAISGATPLGAPPQTKWPFPSLSFYYVPIYQSIYSSEYNQFVQNNLLYVNAGLESMQQLTNAAAAFARGVAGPLAMNNAAAALQSIATNRNFRNTSVPLTQMHDHRNAFSLGVPVTYHQQGLTPTFSYSAESDYISFGGALDYSLALNDKNTTLNAGWSHDGDKVRDDRFKWQSKMSDDLFLGVVQLFGPKAYLTVNTSVGFEHGYLADPYRGVMAATDFIQLNPNDPALIPEKRPRHRDTELIYASWTQFVTPLNASCELSYRLFHDSYGVLANTAELAWHQKLGKQIVLSPMVRYYVQSASDFYNVLVPDYKNLPSFYSSDYRLSEFESFAVGVNVTWRLNKRFSVDAGYMRYLMRGLDGVTSQSAYPQANVFSLGMRLWF
jgi:hypothetical protein